MRELDFAYVGLGVHEEVVYSVADELGYYTDEGVSVSIRDGVRWDDERLRHAAVVGLGRTLLIRLLAGTPWTMLCVNTERPLFWLMARAGFADVSELRGRRVAMHPALVAPGCFARIILRGRGLDPDTDIDAVPMYPGDYSEHIRMLNSGELDAAVIGSTWSPEQLEAEEGPTGSPTPGWWRGHCGSWRKSSGSSPAAWWTYRRPSRSTAPTSPLPGRPER
jgi:ABC-type nitrate/sulfonate/bicarbonate transport system substrate-binding protein